MWPNSLPITAASFNWGPVVFILAICLAMVYYYVKARHLYKGPVFYTEAWQRGNIQ